MSEVLFINPRKRRAKRKTHVRKHRARRVSHMSANPRRKRRTARRVTRMHRNPRRARRASRGGSMNIKGFIGHTVMPAAVGAAGAVALDVAMGYLPLPASLNSGIMKSVVGLVGALGVGILASKVMGRSKGAMVALGGATVVLYNTLKPIIQAAAPSVTMQGLGSAYPSLEFYAAGAPASPATVNQGMGVYQTTLNRRPPVSANRTVVGNMGMYVN